MATSPFEARLVRRYVALGDSFTAGAPSGADVTRWPDELAAALRSANPELDYQNLAVAGATTQEVAARQLEPCIRLRPDLVTVVSGANDVLLSVRPDIGAHEAALGVIFGLLRTELPQAALVTATTPQLSTFIELHPRSRRRVEHGVLALNEATRSVARRHGVLCLEFADHPQAAERDNFADDGFHPSAAGVRRAARACARALGTHFGIRILQEEPA